jgi:hypothetical protein
MKRRINNLYHMKKFSEWSSDDMRAHILSQKFSKCLCYFSEVYSIPRTIRRHIQRLFPFVSNKLRSKLFSVRIDTWRPELSIYNMERAVACTYYKFSCARIASQMSSGLEMLIS